MEKKITSLFEYNTVVLHNIVFQLFYKNELRNNTETNKDFIEVNMAFNT